MAGQQLRLGTLIRDVAATQGCSAIFFAGRAIAAMVRPKAGLELAGFGEFDLDP
jgi:hypothetical protein